jgi:hypothetical protein
MMLQRLIRWWRRVPEPGPAARAERATAMMQAALAEIQRETGCRVVFQPMIGGQAPGALVVTAGWTCVPDPASRGASPAATQGEPEGDSGC